MRKIISTLFIVLLVFSLLGLWPMVTTAQEKVSKPGVYSGYSEPIYAEVVRSSQYVTSFDGTKLAIDIYRPATNGQVVAVPLPAIFTQSNASRTSVRTGSSYNQIAEWVKRGYIFIYQERRGVGASFGTTVGFVPPNDGPDGKAVIEWLAQQPWCNGKVTMQGGSNRGISQTVVAAAQPPHLIAITPGIANPDFYYQLFPNGASGIPTLFGSPKTSPCSAPVTLGTPVDADTDGSLAKAAAEEHKCNYGLPDAFPVNMFRDQVVTMFGAVPANYRPALVEPPIEHMEKIKASGVKMYQQAGWYDASPGGQLLGWKAWEGKIIIGPWTHIQTLAGSNPDFPVGNINMTIEQTRWFDYVLKDIHNGIDREPPIYYYTMNASAGNEWQWADNWPLPNQKLTNYYFDGKKSGTVNSVNDGALTEIPSTATNVKENYNIDYSITVFPAKSQSGAVAGTYSNLTRYWTGNMADPAYPSPDLKGLTFTTDPLTDDIQVTGFPVAHLWVTSTAPDGLFLVYLEEVDSNGKSMYVSSGSIKASHRKVTSRLPWDTLGIPYHRSYQEDYSLLPTGQPVELAFDLYPTSYVFRKGNRIRVTFTASDKYYYQFPEAAPINTPITVSIYRDANHPSFITLPVIPPKPTVFDGTAKVRIAKTTYEGPATLYTFPTAVYLNYGDSWLKWDVFKTLEAGMIEQYRGEGELGRLLVLVINNERVSFDVLAIGNGVHFKGNAD